MVGLNTNYREIILGIIFTYLHLQISSSFCVISHDINGSRTRATTVGPNVLPTSSTRGTYNHGDGEMCNPNPSNRVTQQPGRVRPKGHKQSLDGGHQYGEVIARLL